MITFEKFAQNPLYGGPDTGSLFDVLITKDGERYRMDYSWRNQKSLAVAFSADGYRWGEPTVTLAPEDNGWQERLNRNCVIYHDGFKMWFTGQARGYSYIGYAESDDGLHFHQVGSEPVLYSERPFEGMSVMNPCVLYDNDRYRMWYAAGETYEPNVLAYAESDDGIHWRKCPFNPIFARNPAKEYERDRIGGCQVLKDEKLGYLMFYIGYRDINTACICVAASKDGVTGWKRYKGNPLIAPTPDSWDGEACYKPSALPCGDGWKIWYNGRRGHTEYIGGAYGKGEFSEEDFE